MGFVNHLRPTVTAHSTEYLLQQLPPFPVVSKPLVDVLTAVLANYLLSVELVKHPEQFYVGFLVGLPEEVPRIVGPDYNSWLDVLISGIQTGGADGGAISEPLQFVCINNCVKHASLVRPVFQPACGNQIPSFNLCWGELQDIVEALGTPTLIILTTIKGDLPATAGDEVVAEGGLDDVSTYGTFCYISFHWGSSFVGMQHMLHCYKILIFKGHIF
jgi:hypothetical protein